MLHKILLSFAVVALVLGNVGCSASAKDIAGGRGAVELFHSQLNNQDYGSIYNQADQRFREATKQPDFLAFMTAIHNKLGNVTDATQSSFFVNYTTSGTQIRLSFATKFSAGDAEEEFVWTKSGDRYALLGYHINSMALITK